LIPDGGDRDIIHQIIYEELCLGVVKPGSRTQYLSIMNRLVQEGAEGIILGCTEIELLVQPGDIMVPLFPTARIHTEAAVDMALSL
jgi:aspartate racemase